MNEISRDSARKLQRQDLCGKTFTIGYDNDTKKIENKEKFRVIATMGRL